MPPSPLPARPPGMASAAEVEALLRAGELPVLRYVFARVDTFAHAQELAQETLVRAFCALRDGERPNRPIPWLLGIARHVLLETWRGERYRRQLHERLAHLMGADWESPWHERAPEPWQDGVERRLVVGDAVDALSPDLRQAVLLHYFAGLPVAQVAGHLGTTPSAVKMRLLRARLALRTQLEGLANLEDAMRQTTKATTPTRAARAARGAARGSAATRAARAAAQPPPYEAMSVGLEVGGTRGATMPLSEPTFSGEGLSLDDLRFAAERVQAVRLAGPRPLAPRLTLWPMPDPFEHPEPPTVWSLLRQAEIGNEASHAAAESRLVPTDGWRIGTDPDWRPMLEEFHRVGLRHVWFTFLGLEGTHDSLCGRPGAFAAVVIAMERCAAVGLETGANLVVSARSTGELAALTRLVRSLGAERFVPTYVQSWSPLAPAYEPIRPEPEDLAGLPPADLDANWGYRDFWADPAAFTEAALTRDALASTPPPDSPAGDEPRGLSLRVNASLDLLAGIWWAPPLHPVASLRDDSPEQIHRKLLGLEWPPVPPLDAELARRYGDVESRKVHPRLASVRRKWVHAWRVEQGVPWLASFPG